MFGIFWEEEEEGLQRGTMFEGTGQTSVWETRVEETDEGTVDVPECNWWNGTVQYEDATCNHFVLSRLGSTVASEATRRALECAAYHQTECVQSYEIGVRLPASFIYDAETGIRMVTVPRILSRWNATQVRLDHPDGKGLGRWRTLYREIEVEYLPGGSKRPVTETLHNESAWCVQMLRAGIVPECWEELDGKS